jgi:hypothetical protein
MRYLLYIHMYLLNILQDRYTQELRKIHGDDLEFFMLTYMLHMLRAEAHHMEGM